MFSIGSPKVGLIIRQKLEGTSDDALDARGAVEDALRGEACLVRRCLPCLLFGIGVIRMSLIRLQGHVNFDSPSQEKIPFTGASHRCDGERGVRKVRCEMTEGSVGLSKAEERATPVEDPHATRMVHNQLFFRQEVRGTSLR